MEYLWKSAAVVSGGGQGGSGNIRPSLSKNILHKKSHIFLLFKYPKKPGPAAFSLFVCNPDWFSVEGKSLNIKTGQETKELRGLPRVSNMKNPNVCNFCSYLEGASPGPPGPVPVSSERAPVPIPAP